MKNRVSRSACFCLLFYPLLLFTYPRAAESASTKTVKSEIEKFFLAGRYEEVIEASIRADGQTGPEKLLVAKSLEKLGMFHRANKVMKTLYNSKTPFTEFVPFFIGHNYERLEDYQSALKWYGLTLHTKRGGPDQEAEIVTAAVLERIVVIAGIDSPSFNDCIDTVRKGEIFVPRASYYLGRMFEERGDTERAAACYREAIEGADTAAREKALQAASRNKAVVETLHKEGFRTIDLLALLVENGLFEEALQIVQRLPKNKKTAQITALCHYRKKDYETAEVLYEEYYDNYHDAHALRMLAFCAYHNGKQNQAFDYIDGYLKAEGGKNAGDYEARVLQHDLAKYRLDLDTHLSEAAGLIREPDKSQTKDWIVQEAFYRATGEKQYETAVRFVREVQSDVTSPLGRAWAAFVLGIYEDETLLKNVLAYYPGSYYYFKAANRIELEGDLLSRAERYEDRGMQEEALELLVQLYSTGRRHEHVRNKIESILSLSENYAPYYRIALIAREKQESGLFDFLGFGMYDDLLELITPSYEWAASEQKMVLDFLLSKIYYDTGRFYKSILHAERLLNGYETDDEAANEDLEVGVRWPVFPLFLPREILELLYPMPYIDIVRERIREQSPPFDEYLVLAVMREESRYHAGARSSVGALGLMQLLPTTAHWIAGETLTDEELVEPEKNIEMGITYLDFLFSRFKTPSRVLAAYNGGPGNVRRWLTENPGIDDEVFTEEIPFPETRLFVKKVLRSYYMYRELYQTEHGRVGP
ncbi:MAG: transglycosylase SLT domain-containing protein [Spirochaetes bacterium]|nr:transglycosylase SLT domain-containing protein [Spirochaetota bacterium]